MIKNLTDVTALLDRRFGAAIGRPMSLVRTLVWVVVGIYVLGVLHPAPKVHINQSHYDTALHGTSVRDLILDKNDPRGWKDLKKDPSKFTIAWIGGSTIQTVRPHHYGFIPVDVTRRLPRIDGKPVQVNMYLMEASRIYDLYAATENALKTKPDMVILDLNPIWMFNPNAVQYWNNLNPAVFPDVVTAPSNWPLIAATNSPSDVALSAAASHLSAIRDRWSYAQRLHSIIDNLAPNAPKVDPTAQQKRLTGTALIATMQAPLNFWDRYRPFPNHAPPGRGYEAIMAESKTDGSIINDDVVARTLGSLADSRIPSIAYTSAVDPATLADPGVDSTLHRIESHLQQIADQHRAPTLLVKSKSAIRYVHGLKFRDMAHTTYDNPLVDYLTGLVCSHLTGIDPKTQCTPTPRTATR